MAATMAPAPPTPRWRSALPLLLAIGVAIAGFRATWFLCDDAFINYRYCANAYEGHGFVWNPPPWAPVEGYTSFGWVAGLYLVWVVTGLPPPVTAIPITLTAGLLLLWLVARRLRAEHLPEAWRTWAPWFAGAVLLGIAGNHSFATWLSSGMETMVFALLALLWTRRATNLREATFAGDLAWLATWAALAHLVRPDGDLLALATLGVGLHGFLLRGQRSRAVLAAALPLLVPVAHVLWRRWFYGEWQPNTWYAKVVEPWPASGLRHLYCFAVESGLWWWLLLALVWLAVAACRGGAPRLLRDRFGALTAVATWLAHAGYYTLVVGGDHFAYRVFVHLVPLCWLASAAMLASLRANRSVALGWLFAFLGLGTVPGWWMERALVGHEADGFARAAPTVPALLRPLLAGYDRCQAWLHVHSVNFRRATHAFYCAAALSDLPERRAGWIEGAVPGQRLVYRVDAVGVVGWSLADVAIVDGKGLNDWVIARNRQDRGPPFDVAVLRAAFPTFDTDPDRRLDPRELGAASPLLVSIGPALRPEVWADVLLALGDDDGDERLDVDELAQAVLQMLPPRQMAHEREPPAGYVEDLRPNVEDRGGRRRLRPDVVPLTDDELRAVEARWRLRMGRRAR